MKTLIDNLFSFGEQYPNGSRMHLTLFELFVAAYTIIYAWDWGMYILRIEDLVLPLGLANYIDISIFYGNNLALINAVLISCATAFAFFSSKYKWLYFPAFLLLHLQYVTRFSLGEIPHSSNLVGFSMLGLGLGGVFLRKPKDQLHFAFGFTVFFMGLGYTSAAFSKLIGTGLSWVDGNHLWLWVAEKSVDVLSATGDFRLSWVQELALTSRGAATAILTFGLLTEMIGFLIWWRRFRPYAMLLLIGMHIGIYLSMNIFFLSFTIELFIIGFPWYKWFEKLSSSPSFFWQHIHNRFSDSRPSSRSA